MFVSMQYFPNKFTDHGFYVYSPCSLTINLSHAGLVHAPANLMAQISVRVDGY